jgi:hypothetical protein
MAIPIDLVPGMMRRILASHELRIADAGSATVAYFWAGVECKSSVNGLKEIID